MNYVLDMYRQMFDRVKRGYNKGAFCNAKPILLISLIDHVVFIKENKFRWGNRLLEDIYKTNFSDLDTAKLTPLWKPFYYMSSEPFYSLVWEQEPDAKELARPSGKTLRTYLSYSKFDDELWELLQNAENRDYLRKSIIKTYFS